MNTEKQVKIGQEPAFGVGYEKLRSYAERYGTYKTPEKELGMSKCFYAACAAMQGLLSNPNTAGQIKLSAGDVDAKTANAIVCRTAYEIAEELLKQEQL